MYRGLQLLWYTLSYTGSHTQGRCIQLVELRSRKNSPLSKLKMDDVTVMIAHVARSTDLPTSMTAEAHTHTHTPKNLTTLFPQYDRTPLFELMTGSDCLAMRDTIVISIVCDQHQRVTRRCVPSWLGLRQCHCPRASLDVLAGRATTSRPTLWLSADRPRTVRRT